MLSRLVDRLRCPSCGARLEAVEARASSGGEVHEGALRCPAGHRFPVRRGIPRLLGEGLDLPTQENFSHEWAQHALGDRTWGMELRSRVEDFFVWPMRIPPEALAGSLVLDAGCGNGSQSVAYTRLGCEVIAVDLSSGVELGQALREGLEGAAPEKVHFVQADLQRPPFAPALFDVIHSAGVLHHTPDTKRTFEALVPLLRPGGTFYVWLYKYEAGVTPLVNGLRRLTTRLSAKRFAGVARVAAPAFQAFCWLVDRLGLRAYPPLARREAALALMDIFGAPYAHHHSFEEVERWFRARGFDEVWLCNDGRRGFGVCGRLGGASKSSAPSESEAVAASRARTA